MIKSVKIENFKCLGKETFDFKPLTIITGVNSSGKSSLIQATLLPIDWAFNRLGPSFSRDFEELRNKYLNAKEVNIDVELNAGKLSLTLKDDIENDNHPAVKIDGAFPLVLLESNLFYLSANRSFPNIHQYISDTFFVGIHGEHLFGTFEKEKSKPIMDRLIKEKDRPKTLSAQVDYWLSYITNVKMALKTKKVTANMVEVRYDSDGFTNLTPHQVGTGITYITQILIVCLRAKEDNILIIENPEIHLHPKSQSLMAEFLSFIANNGVQVIIETQCENLITKVQHQVYKHKSAGTISKDDVIFLYKPSTTKPFIKLNVDLNGRFVQLNKDGNSSIVEFPEGFFDATIEEFLEFD